ncbi:MAG: hypothetical protein DMF96_16380 [Acidobacteria bacterium]|nr:MAG: hypothetical protein DMF96_16380 [Acidobacteriota bacterium]
MDQAAQLLELPPQVGEQPRATLARDRRGNRDVPLHERPQLRRGALCRAVFSELRRRDERVGDAGQRRYDDDGRCGWRRAELMTDDADQADDGVGIRHGRPAELHDDAHDCIPRSRGSRGSGGSR